MKKDDRWTFISQSSNSIFSLWYLKRSIFTKKYINNENLTSKTNNFSKLYNEIAKTGNLYDFTNAKIKISYLDSIFYMRNQLLRDSDWASKFHCIELRNTLCEGTCHPISYHC